MINFANITSFLIEDEYVTKVSCDDTTLWENTSVAEYTFKSGKWEFDDGSWIEVSNGNHVHFYNVSGKGAYFNISDIEQNTTNATSVNNVDNKQSWFVIPAGSKCILKMSNVTNHMPDTNFRLALKSESAEFYIGDDDDRLSTKIVMVIEEDIDVSCLFSYMDYNMEVEFDVIFIVDGRLIIGTG